MNPRAITRGGGEEALLSGYCERLLESGIPLLRGCVAQRTLHPIYTANSLEWWRGREEVQLDRFETADEETSEAWMHSPFRHMVETESPRLRVRLDKTNAAPPFPLLAELREQAATDYLALATHYGEAEELGPVNGIISSWTTDAAGGFSDRAARELEAALPTFALAMKSASTYRIASGVIRTYLGRDAGRRVLQGKIGRGSADTIRSVLWYCDLQGFTKIAETMARDQIIAMLNAYFECVVEPVDARGGEVLKFMGDGLLAIFTLDDDFDVCRSALDAAEEALGRIAELNAARAEGGLPVLVFNLALHFGDVSYGNIGARERLDFTVVGPAVNEASRIEAMCRSLERDLVISSSFARAGGRCTDRLVSLGRYALRGVREPQELFTLLPRDDAPPAEGGTD